MFFSIVLIAVGSYFIGSIPIGFLVARSRGVDLRQIGSGNIGATNVLRTFGKPLGYLVFVLDAVKGVSAVALAHITGRVAAISGEHAMTLAVIATLGCVIGHSFPVWLRFKGGKGVATSAGALFALMPLAALIGIVIWVIVFESTRYVSIASISAVAALPVILAVFFFLHQTDSVVLLTFSILIALLVVWRHRSNLIRLRAGTEQRFVRK